MKIETYRNLIDHIAAPVLILGEQDVICYVNQDTIDLLGCDTVEQIQGVDFKSYISPEHRDVFNQSCQSIMQDNTSHVCDYILIRQDRSAISVQLTGAGVHDEAGLVSQTIWTLQELITPIQDHIENGKQKKIENLQWLSEQARILLSITNHSNILDFTGKELQKKITDSIVLTLTFIDESSFILEGIYGLEDNLLPKIWKLIGKS